MASEHPHRQSCNAGFCAADTRYRHNAGTIRDSRLLAGSKAEAILAVSGEQRQRRPRGLSLEQVQAITAGLNSLTWCSPTHHCSLFDDERRAMRRDLPLDDQAQPLGGFSLILEWCNVMVAGRNSSRRSGDRMAVVQLLPPVALHDYRYLGANFRERERIKHKRQRWTDRLHRLLMLETAGVARRDTCGLADLPSPEMTMPASEVTWKALTG